MLSHITDSTWVPPAPLSSGSVFLAHPRYSYRGPSAAQPWRPDLQKDSGSKMWWHLYDAVSIGMQSMRPQGHGSLLVGLRLELPGATGNLPLAQENGGFGRRGALPSRSDVAMLWARKAEHWAKGDYSWALRFNVICLIRFWIYMRLLTPFLFLPFGIGMSLLCLSHYCPLEVHSMFGFTGSQVGRSLLRMTHTSSLPRIWFRWCLDESLDLDLKVDTATS